MVLDWQGTACRVDRELLVCMIGSFQDTGAGIEITMFYLNTNNDNNTRYFYPYQFQSRHRMLSALRCQGLVLEACWSRYLMSFLLLLRVI